MNKEQRTKNKEQITKSKWKIHLFSFVLCYLFFVPFTAHAASVVATVNGTPITDMDITARTKLMAMQGQTPTDNRKQALTSIIDDNIKLAYADSLKLNPTDDDVAKQIADMKQHGFNPAGMDSATSAMMRSAIRANIAWQMVIGRTIMPTITVTPDDINAEMADLARDKGLPVELTLIRLVGIPENVAKMLSAPKSCDDAESIAKNLGGSPQRMDVKEYELSADVRAQLAGLPLLTWSKRGSDDSVFLICSKKKTAEYGKLDSLVKQSATFKRAAFVADQQLKQLRRKAVIIINDDRYKSAIN